MTPARTLAHRALVACVLAVAQACPLGAAAQPALPHPLRTLGPGDGLPSATVYDVAFDREGWMWLATAAGLYRYDGVDFVAYRSARARHAETHALQEGPDGALYVANFRKQVFRVAGDSLAVALELGMDFANFSSYALSSGGLAVHVDSLLFTRPFGSGAPPAVQRVPGTTWPETSRLLSSGVGPAVLVSGDGAAIATLEFDRFTPLPPDTVGRVHCLAMLSGAATLLNAADDGERLVLRRVTPGGLRALATVPNPLPRQVVRDALLLPDGRLAIAGNRGAFISGTGVLAGRPADWRRITGPADAAALATDAAGKLWVATLDQGLLRVDLDLPAAQDYPELSGGLSAFAKTDSGLLVAATQTGDLYTLGEAAVLTGQSKFSSVLWRDGRGRLWFGYHHGVDAGGRASPRTLPGLPNLNRLSAAVALGSDEMALAVVSGVYLYGACDAGSFGASPTAHAARLLHEGRIVGLAYDRSTEQLWVAHWRGISVYPRTGRARNWELPDDPTVVAAVPRTRIGAGGSLVAVGTGGRGLLALADTAARPTPVTSLAGHSVERVTPSPRGLWVVTEAGLSHCVRAPAGGGLLCKLAATDGELPAGAPSSLLEAADTLYLGYGRRVYRMPVARLLTRERAPAALARFAALERGGETVALAAGEAEVDVPADEGPVTLHPRAPVYPAQGPPRYRYRISTLDTNWRAIEGPRPEVYLHAVPPGRHRVELALAGASPEAATATLTLVARRAWYRRPWVYVATAALALGAGSLWTWRRLRRRERMARLRADMRRARLTALSAQMNPHFMFNALNAIQEFIVDEDARAASTYLGLFSKLMRLTLEHSRRETVTLASEVEAMRVYTELERLRTDQTVAVDFVVDGALPRAARLPPLLTQPLIENAFKHGLLPSHDRPRRLRVRYAPTEPPDEDSLATHRMQPAPTRQPTDLAEPPWGVAITVEDNGVGRRATRSETVAPGAGFALDATTRRLALLNEDDPGGAHLFIDDLLDARGAPAGTRARLYVRLRPGRPPHDAPQADDRDED